LAWKRWGQVLIPGTVLTLAPLAMTASIISLSAIAEPAIAGDSARSMPANREGVRRRHPLGSEEGMDVMA
jgi:hypothetical protein